MWRHCAPATSWPNCQAGGIDVLQSTPAEFAAYMRSEGEKWAKVVKAANIRAD